MLFKIFIFILICCYYNLYLTKVINYISNEKEVYWNNEKINISSIKEEIINYENISITSISSLNLKKYEEINNPKISLIIPIYNNQINIINCYLSICNQSLKDIEIIFINDASKDNSSNIIEELMLIDKRIILLNNETNKREFNSKKKGALKAKGEYIYIINPNDLLLNNILEKAYNTAKNYNLDILQFYIMIGNYKTNRIRKSLKYKSGIFNYSKIKNILYNCYSPSLKDKIIKREIFINSLKFTGEYYNNDIYDYSDDDLIIFGLSNEAKSYGFLEVVGYFYYIRYPWFSMDPNYRVKHIDLIFSKLFNVTKFFFETTKNNREEKFFAYKFFYNKIYIYRNKLFHLTQNFDYINDILNQFLYSRFYYIKEKERIQKFQNELLIIKSKNAKYYLN